MTWNFCEVNCFAACMRIRDGWQYQNGWILEKFQRGAGGHFQSKNLCCRFWTYKQGFLSMKVEEKSQHDFPKIGGEGGLKAIW